MFIVVYSRGSLYIVASSTSNHPVNRLFNILLVSYLCLLLLITAFDACGPDVWWFTGANLYAPQGMWAVPAFLLAPFALRARRRAMVALAVGLLWVIGPMSGFNIPLKAAHAEAKDATIRVLTYNVKWAYRDSSAEAADIARFNPDVIQFQDSGGVMNSAIGEALVGYHVEVSGQFIVASKLPLAPLQDDNISFAGSRHHVCRGAIKVGKQWVALYDVHLLSPREGLIGIRHHSIQPMIDNIGARLEESRRLADYVSAETGPVIVTGDFNAPVQSKVCRYMFNSGLSDAFLNSGFGYGYTYGAFTKAQSSYVRIDHIFYNDRIGAKRCWVGNRVGSDHCPVIADIIVKSAL